MSTIGSATGGYYQLANLLSSGSGKSTSNTGSASTLQSLEALLDASSASGSSGSDSYLLDLSPQAQQWMSGTSTGSASGSSSSFTLTSTQQTAIQNILDKYKDAPLTQATFQEIEAALQQAGLSPQTLGAEDQVKSFNPTDTLLQALSGNYSGVQDPSTTASDEQTKETNYMEKIASLWKSMDSSTSSTDGASTAISTTSL